jgi:hypothetical protein
MKNLIKIFIVALLFASCEETQPVIFDPATGQTLVTFGATTSTLTVIIDEVGDTNVALNITTLSSTDRVVNISVDASSTANAENYSVPSSVTIPAGDFTTSFTISGVDNSVETSVETIVLKIDSVDGDGLVSEGLHTVSMFQICPVPDTYFVGDYLIQEVTPISPGNGVALSNNTIVSVFTPLDADDEPILTQRAFATEAFPMFCGGSFFDFEINLVCNELVVPLGRTTCSCGGMFDDYFGPSPVSTTYDVSDDTFITLNFQDDVQDACGGGTSTVTYNKI